MNKDVHGTRKLNHDAHQQVPTVHSDESAGEAFKTLKRHAEMPWLVYKPLIVVDDAGNMIGLVTLKCLLRAIGLDDVSTRMENSVEDWRTFFQWKPKQWAEQPVAEVMRPLTEVCVDADMSVLDAARLLLEKDVNIVAYAWTTHSGRPKDRSFVYRVRTRFHCFQRHIRSFRLIHSSILRNTPGVFAKA